MMPPSPSGEAKFQEEPQTSRKQQEAQLGAVITVLNVLDILFGYRPIGWKNPLHMDVTWDLKDDKNKNPTINIQKMAR